MMKYTLLFVGFIALVCGIALCAIGITYLADAHEYAVWHTTTGHVVSASIEKEKHTSGRTENIFFHPEIVYEYTVDDVTYRAARLYFDPPRSIHRHEAERHLHGYPSGAVVSVHYMPSSPADAVLHPSVPVASMMPLGGGITLLIIGIFFIVAWALRMMQTGDGAPRRERAHV